MTGPRIKEEFSPEWTLEGDVYSVVLADYTAQPTCTLTEDAYGSYTDIEKCSPYGPFIDYTYSKVYPATAQYINPSATVLCPIEQPSASSPPTPPSFPPSTPSPPPFKASTFTGRTRQGKKRSSTSYDLDTTLYLKSVFFDVYSKQNKLTKQQRLAVIIKTGLPSRNITYWFSNHKRRFKKALEVYKATVKNSRGKITCYEDFLLWRRSQNLPDDVTRSEMENL